MTSYHVDIYDTGSGIGIQCPNNGAQFNKCRLQGCMRKVSIYLNATIYIYVL